MKNFKIACLGIVLILSSWSCKKSFLSVTPQGQLSAIQLENLAGIESSLISAYTMLNGNLTGSFNSYSSTPSFWVWGEVAADNAHKGSDPTDVADITFVETHDVIPTNSSLSEIWLRRFEGILRCNNTLKILNNTPSVNGTQRGAEIKAEVYFLRAHYYFDLWKIFKYVPYITEETADPAAVTNDKDIIGNITADMIYAEQNLPVNKPLNQVGRPDKIAAKAYLGRIYLYQNKHAEALPLLKEVIASRPDLASIDFRDNFDPTKENGPESIFANQASVNDGTGGSRGNVGDMLNAPLKAGLPQSCCGFLNPSFDLVNAYRVDANGLPDFDNLHNSYFPSSFDDGYTVPTNLSVDTRLDYTVSRQGLPVRDWGIMEGLSWIRNPGNDGPFVGYKHLVDATNIAMHTQAGATNITGLNINIIRLADVYLMAAECAVEAGDLVYAMSMVNKVRERASKLPAKKITVDNTLVNGADYKVGLYTTFPSPDYAKKAIQWERRLELALEGYRFFDLRRWGILQSTLAAYATYESKKLPYVKGIADNDYYYPIPQSEIDNSKNVLKQH